LTCTNKKRAASCGALGEVAGPCPRTGPTNLQTNDLHLQASGSEEELRASARPTGSHPR